MYRTLLSLTFASFLLLHGCAGDTGTETAPTDDAAPATDTDLGEADLGEPAGPEAMESGSAADAAPPEQSEPEVPTPPNPLTAASRPPKTARSCRNQAIDHRFSGHD